MPRHLGCALLLFCITVGSRRAELLNKGTVWLTWDSAATIE